MQNILIVSATPGRGPLRAIIFAAEAVGHRLCVAALDGPSAEAMELLCRAFDGRPPDVILADLSEASDCLPLRHVRRLLRQTWGDDMPVPPCLALLHPRQLALADWPAYADDFLLPPYVAAEALARITLLLFRHRQVGSQQMLKLADVTLDLGGGLAQDTNGQTVPLTPREFDLLRFLCMHRGKFFARDRLLDLVWGVDFEGGERTVDIHILRLRAKLPSVAAALLETRRGVGYGMRSPV